MDMVNIKHAKKAQALASDLDYRKKLHEYTVLPEDMKTQWARKAYGLQSEVSPTHCHFPPHASLAIGHSDTFRVTLNLCTSLLHNTEEELLEMCRAQGGWVRRWKYRCG